jgi:hypothetical protein
LRQASNKGTLRVLAMLTVSQLSKSFAGRALFDDVSPQVNRGAANGWSTTRTSIADELSR